MVKGIAILILSLFVSTGFAQQMGSVACPAYGIDREPMSYRQPGLLEASVTFTPSTMLARKSNNFYLTGFAEYHFHRRVSLRSDSYFHLNGVEDNPFVNNAFRSYFGVLYHFVGDPVTNFDATIGFQPGLTLMSKNNTMEDLTESIVEPNSRNVLSPSFNISLGVKYYILDNFNFFLSVNYFKSTIGGIPDGPLNTDEIAFSAGLGFQIQTKKLWRE